MADKKQVQFFCENSGFVRAEKEKWEFLLDVNVFYIKIKWKIKALQKFQNSWAQSSLKEILVSVKEESDLSIYKP